jgi:hypothetical protein
MYLIEPRLDAFLPSPQGREKQAETPFAIAIKNMKYSPCLVVFSFSYSYKKLKKLAQVFFLCFHYRLEKLEVFP